VITIEQASQRRRKRRRALDDLHRLLEDRKSIIVTHYSCESLNDRPDGSSPRVTSIAVRDFSSGQTTSFSIHQVAERHGVPIDEIGSQYDEFEKQMLSEFSEHVHRHNNCWWVHWNMRDGNYGFSAIAHRSRVLGLDPIEPHEDRRFDLARTLHAFYGAKYAEHPRLPNLVKSNEITDKDMLTGNEEAEAFEKGEYVRLHQSTLRKVAIIANILERLEEGRLKTNATYQDQYGTRLAAFAGVLKDHPWPVVGISIIGVAGFIITVINWIT